jgi:hypothetical protein
MDGGRESLHVNIPEWSSWQELKIRSGNDLPFSTSPRLWPFNRIMDLQYPSATGN